jgi:RNA polymerase sigma-70 factor (ECF subfamily)
MHALGLSTTAGFIYRNDAACRPARRHRMETAISAPPAAQAPLRPNDSQLALLIQLCAEGDRIAFRRLYDLQSARLYGIGLRITRQAGLAADAVHDAFLQVWQQAARFDPARGSAEAWLVSLVRYRALDIIRRTRREVGGLEPPEQADPAADPLALLMESTDGAALHRCLDELEEDRRRLVVLAFVEGLTHSELATTLSVPLGTIKSWIRRSLASLKRCLEA